MLVPANQIPVGEGLLPDGRRAPFFIDRNELNLVKSEGPEWKYEDSRFIDEAVCDPDVIFEGLRRPEQAQSFCYSVQPTHDPDKAEDEDPYGQGLPPTFGQVFLAFVRAAPMGFLVFDWEWREVSADEPGHPDNWQEDFAERVWQRL
jgi:hypothetical protein